MAEPYFDDMAEYYDHFWGEQQDQEEELAFVRSHARGGRVLDVGVGTGRLAIPLAQDGLRVHGVDDSIEMLHKLRAKAAQNNVTESVTSQQEDLTLRDVSGSYSLIIVVYHTLYYAHSREEQAEFFRAARRLLVKGGRLVIEAYQPTEKRMARWRSGVHPIAFDPSGVQLEFYDHKPHDRTVRTGRLVFTEAGPRYSYHVDRYLWPDEMDKLADSAGLSLISRHAGWLNERFHPTKSGRSVSLYAA